MLIGDDDKRIAVVSDNNTETKTFCLNRIYKGIDLSQFAVWLLAETVNGLMVIPNLIALFGLSPHFFHLIHEYKKTY